MCANKDNPVCSFCKGSHYSNEIGTPLSLRSCPEFLKQKRMKEMMAVYNLSNFEAMELIGGEQNKNRLMRLNDNQVFPSLSGTEVVFNKDPNTLGNFSKALMQNAKKNFNFTRTSYSPVRPFSPKRRNEVPSELLFFPNGNLPEGVTKRSCTERFNLPQNIVQEQEVVSEHGGNVMLQTSDNLISPAMLPNVAKSNNFINPSNYPLLKTNFQLPNTSRSSN